MNFIATLLGESGTAAAASTAAESAGAVATGAAEETLTGTGAQMATQAATQTAGGALTGAGQAAQVAGQTSGGGNFMSNLISAGKASQPGVGMGETAQAFMKMFGQDMSEDDVSNLNVFKLQNKPSRDDSKDASRNTYDDMMRVMGFLGQ